MPVPLLTTGDLGSDPSVEHGPSDRAARSAILTLLAARGPDKTICPSEAARAIGGETWRNAMPVVHAAVRGLAEAGVVEVRQGGEVREAGDVVGAYRVALGSNGTV